MGIDREFKKRIVDSLEEMKYTAEHVDWVDDSNGIEDYDFEEVEGLSAELAEALEEVSCAFNEAVTEINDAANSLGNVQSDIENLLEKLEDLEEEEPEEDEEQDAKKMTIEEIEKKLGYKVEVIN
jgi:septation ring formation regulator EzrA